MDWDFMDYFIVTCIGIIIITATISLVKIAFF